MKTILILAVTCLVVIVGATPVWQRILQRHPPSEGQGQDASLTEVNRALTNPIGSLWPVAFQQNNNMLDMGLGRESYWNSNLNFQPGCR
jgi:hypothetical protein